MEPERLHLLYEHGTDERPFGSAYIRLLRPLTHPVFRGKLEVTSGLAYDGSPVDAVIVDRLWRPDICLGIAEQLRQQTRRAGARLLYALDDDLVRLAEEQKDWRPTAAQMRALMFFLTESDGIIVPTAALREKLLPYCPNIEVVPNMLDDRLLNGPGVPHRDHPLSFTYAVNRAVAAVVRGVRSLGRRHLTVGYMGTFTHDDDLTMILPALEEVCKRHEGNVGIAILGVTASPETRLQLSELPVRLIQLNAQRAQYPRFMRWFSRNINWDIAVAPLRRTSFNRCKSDIKFLDYSAIGAAGIYSRVPAYEGSVVHRDTGWLTENTVEAWHEALESLIGDVALRARIAHSAREHLHSRRTVACSADRWLSALQRLRERAE